VHGRRRYADVDPLKADARGDEQGREHRGGADVSTAGVPTTPGRVVGHIAALWRYPVKSMAGHQLPEVDVGWQGLAGDRRWAFVRPNSEANGFPWMTIRERAEMWGYRPAFVEPDRPGSSPTVVATPSGDELDVADPRLAARLGDGVRLIRQDRGASNDIASA
jgi:uncharacterized protein YcbX